MDLEETADKALREIGAVVQADTLEQLKPLGAHLLKADRIFLHGVGREGLVMKALAMRLFHLGLRAHLVGDMNCPPIGAGDALFVSAGPGHFETVASLARIAGKAGATVLCATAEPSGIVPRASDFVLLLRAQTMASDQENERSVLPMGSVYEMQLFFLFEMLVLHLQSQMGTSHDAMRANHTNLE